MLPRLLASAEGYQATRIAYEPCAAPGHRSWIRAQAPHFDCIGCFIAMMGAFPIVTIFAGLALSSPLRRASGNSDLPPPLRFTSNGTLQISIFEDLHFGENAWDSWGPQQDINTVKVMNQVLDAEPQKLVVLKGDLITGENAYLENATVKIDQIVAPLLARGLTWASTYGNHDSQYNLSRHAILTREHRWPRHARTQQMVHGPDAGVSNYYLPVYPSTGSTDAPCLLLWFFDSRGGFHFQRRNASSGVHIGQPDWVDQSVVTLLENHQCPPCSAIQPLLLHPLPSLRAHPHPRLPSRADVAGQNRPPPPTRRQRGRTQSRAANSGLVRRRE